MNEVVVLTDATGKVVGADGGMKWPTPPQFPDYDYSDLAHDIAATKRFNSERALARKIADLYSKVFDGRVETGSPIYFCILETIKASRRVK